MSWENSFIPNGQPSGAGWESSFMPAPNIQTYENPPAHQSVPAAMGSLTVPQAEVGYLLNSVNGIPGINLLKEAGAGIRGLAAAATGGDFSEEYNKSRENQQKLMYNAEQQFPTQTGIGQISAGVGSMGLLPTAGPTGSMIADAGMGAMQGAGYGALGGFGAGTDTDGRLSNALDSGKFGAGFGGVAGLAAGSLNNLVGAYRGLYPTAKLAAAKDAIEEGIPVYKSNLSDSKALGYLSSASNEIPSWIGGTSGRVPAQQAAMAEAINARMGQSGDELSNINVQDALTNAGQEIGKINSKYSMPFDKDTRDAISIVQQNAKNSLTGDNLKLFNQQVANIKANTSRGQLPGDKYQQIRSGLNEDIMANNQGSAAKYGKMLQSLRNAIDDRFQAQATPEDALNLQRNRAYYQNASTISPLMERYPLGDYPMGALNARTIDNQAMQPLGNAGQLFKNITGNSGTAQREMLQKLGGGIAGMAGAGAFAHELDPDWEHNALELGGMALGPGLANRAFNPRVTNFSLNGVNALENNRAQIQAIANLLRKTPAAAASVNDSLANLLNQGAQ